MSWDPLHMWGKNVENMARTPKFKISFKPPCYPSPSSKGENMGHHGHMLSLFIGFFFVPIVLLLYFHQVPNVFITCFASFQCVISLEEKWAFVIGPCIWHLWLNVIKCVELVTCNHSCKWHDFEMKIKNKNAFLSFNELYMYYCLWLRCN